MFSILFGLFLLFSLPGFEKVNAATFNELTGCNLTADQKKYYSDNFKSELAKRNLEEFIWKDGRKLYINKEFTINNCLPLYGSHKDVQSYGKDCQRRDQYGNYKFLGYNADKLPVLNAQYYELEMQHDLLNKRKLVYHPWKDKSLNASITPYNSKPTTKNSYTRDVLKGYSRTELLDTAIDSAYINAYPKWKKSQGGLGPRGYFPKYNSVIKSDLRGPNLINYSSVEFYPGLYSFGSLVIYHLCYNDTIYCYTSHYMPPIKNIFDDNPDLAVTSFATQPWEGEKVKFTYTIKNVGDVNIVNPKGYISYAGNKLSVSFKGVSEPGESASGELVARSPQVSKDEKYTATIFMNPDENNPKFEPMGNNKKTIELTVKNIERDLYVDSIRIEGNTYFDGNLDKLAKLFEGEEVYFEYKLGFYSNKPDEKMVNPVVFYGKEGGKQKEEQITKTIKAGEKTGWIKPTFKYQNH